MENSIQIFDYNNVKVRTVVKDNEPWFVLKDVCEVLGLGTPARVAERLEEDEVSQTHVIDSIGRKQETWIINESGLYNVVLRSDKPEAKPFRKWVTSEVLPSIRKTGGYVGNDDLFIATYLPTADENTKLLFKTTLEVLKSQNKKIADQNKQLEEQKPLVDFANHVSNTTDLVDMERMSKFLHDRRIQIGRNRLFKILREEKILTKKNLPYQRYMERGYFEVKESVYRMDGEIKVRYTTYVTGKGQQFIYKKILSIAKGMD